MLDVLIVGGGPAGLAAALFLGRCRRKVLLVDAGRPRNERSRWVSGFPTRDGTKPMELRQLAESELAKYPSVATQTGEVRTATRSGEGFEIVLDDGERLRSRKLVLATGLMNDVPDFPNSREFFGRGVYPCPYCDGWEHRDEHIVAQGRGSDGREMALELTAWSRDILLLTHGPSGLEPEEHEELRGRGIEVAEERIARLEGDPDGEGLARIVLESGRVIESRALFYAFNECRQSHLIEELGCDMSEKGAVDTGHCEKTNVPGLYVPGDASRRVKFAVVAAAEGAMAAFAINTELLKEDLAREARQLEAAAA